MRRTPTIAGAVLVSVLTVGGVAWANGSSDGASAQGKKDCPQSRDHAGWAHHGTAGKITAVTSTSITVTGRDGKAQTVKIDANTKISTGHDEGTAADLKPGWIAFIETGSNGVATVIRAADPAEFRAHAGPSMFDPKHVAGGRITAVSASSITLTGRDGTKQTVKVNAGTKVFSGRDAATLSALKAGWLAFVEKNDAGVATVIRAIDPAKVRSHFNQHRFSMPHNIAAGKITAVSASSITLEGRDGKSVKVAVNASTKVLTHDGEVQLSALKTGWFAFAIKGKDGAAVVIRAADPAQFGHHEPAATTASL
jgi:hypothetical protein